MKKGPKDTWGAGELVRIGYLMGKMAEMQLHSYDRRMEGLHRGRDRECPRMCWRWLELESGPACQGHGWPHCHQQRWTIGFQSQGPMRWRTPAVIALHVYSRRMSQRRAEVWETLFVLNREAWNWTKGGKKNQAKEVVIMLVKMKWEIGARRYAPLSQRAPKS